MTNDYKSSLNELLSSGEASFLTKGCSMRPLFREHRDIVVISRVTSKLKRGDVVLYGNADMSELILHRIIKVDGEKLTIRGDNNFFIEHRKTADIVGILTAFFRDGRHCDIKVSKKYKLYSFYILNTYFFRFAWRLKIRPLLSKIKRTLFKLFGLK